MTIYYHITDRAEDVVREGFRDPEVPQLLGGRWMRGMLLSDWPVGPDGDETLEVVLPTEMSLTEWAILEYGAVAEWCPPAALVNERATVRLLARDEIDELVRSGVLVRRSRGS